MIHDPKIAAAITSLMAALILYLQPKLDPNAAASVAALIVAAVVNLFTRPPGSAPPEVKP